MQPVIQTFRAQRAVVLADENSVGARKFWQKFCCCLGFGNDLLRCYFAPVLNLLLQDSSEFTANKTKKYWHH